MNLTNTSRNSHNRAWTLSLLTQATALQLGQLRERTPIGTTKGKKDKCPFMCPCCRACPMTAIIVCLAVCLHHVLGYWAVKLTN